MRFCTECGKELPEDAGFCANCGNQVAIMQQKKTKRPKCVNKAKIIKIVIATVLVLLVISSGVVGFLIYKNHVYVDELELKLADTTYEYKGLNPETDNYQVYWLTLYDTGRYRLETVDFTTEESDEWFGDFYIEVGFEGDAKVMADTAEYTIHIDPSGEIEMLSIGENYYYPLANELSGRNLVDWYNEVVFEGALEKNREEALEMFANISYWDTGDKFDNLIPVIFKEYDVFCEPVEGSNTEFHITVSGLYYFNKVNFPTLTRQGEIRYAVKVNGGECTFKKEKDDGIIDAMNVYVVLSTYGSYGW